MNESKGQENRIAKAMILRYNSNPFSR
jgi:hypothetical protein